MSTEATLSVYENFYQTNPHLHLSLGPETWHPCYFLNKM